MTKKILALCAFTMMAVLTVVPPVQAQPVHLRISVPFEFDFNGTVLPAGVYTIDTVGNRGIVSVVQVGSAGRTAYLPVMDAGDDRSPDLGARMVFSKVGDRYFMRQIWRPDGNGGVAVPLSRAAKEAELASVKTEEVTVLARR